MSSKIHTVCSLCTHKFKKYFLSSSVLTLRAPIIKNCLVYCSGEFMAARQKPPPNADGNFRWLKLPELKLSESFSNFIKKNVSLVKSPYIVYQRKIELSNVTLL